MFYFSTHTLADLQSLCFLEGIVGAADVFADDLLADK
jgi:hypothetical protein